MSLFAKYDPEIRSVANFYSCVKPANRDHVSAIAKLISERDDLNLDKTIKSIHGEFDRIVNDDVKKFFCVAETENGVVGFGRCQFLPTKSITGASGMPEGWYLMGTIVDPNYRRQGIGRELCALRIKWLQQFTNVVYYYASALNRASIKLHEEFGFREISRNFRFPGLDFTGGVGILFRAKISESNIRE